MKWHKRFLNLSKEISTWSKDPSTKCGAVIVRPDKTIASVGYNGYPRCLEDKNLTDREYKYSRTVHCEMNALISYNGSVKGHTLYTWPMAPCDRCIVHMLQAGITCFVFPACKIDRWKESVDKTKSYIEEAGLKWIEFYRDGDTVIYDPLDNLGEPLVEDKDAK